MEQKNPEENKKKPWLNAYVRFSGIAFQMGATIFAGAYLGKYLDATYSTTGTKWYTMIFTLVGVGLSLFNILRQLKKLNK